ncbi:MAG TPA: amidohydrolase family protein [Gemmatimonadaceae bacterium]|nr:amidohydrolase family protein [Gemmatimonadaceae bacterium]
MRNEKKGWGMREGGWGISGRALRAVVCFVAMPAAAATAQPGQGTVRPPSPVPLPGGAAAAYAIRNATVVPIAGAPIPNGTVVIRDGRIEAVGAGSSVQVPADATVIDASGMYVYPGLIDSGTQLGLTEISSVPGGVDTEEVGDFNPHNVALTAVNAHSELIPVTRVNGVTTALTAARGGIVSGQASLVDLSGWTPGEMAVKRQAAMVMTYPTVSAGRRGGGGFGGFGQQRSDAERREEYNRQVRLLKSYLADARAYADVRGRTGSAAAGAPRTNLAMEAMIPVLRGQLPVVFDVNSAEQIRGVLALADSFGLKVVLRGANEAWRLADTLAARRIPVIVGPTSESPDDAEEPYDEIYANPGVLARAGVKIAFQTEEASNVRNLPYQAALATAYGLDTLEALRALTINPAEIWGVADRLGTIERGKVANLFVTTGNPLDVRSVPKYLFIRGQMVPLTDRHTRLYEQFRARPKPSR